MALPPSARWSNTALLIDVVRDNVMRDGVMRDGVMRVACLSDKRCVGQSTLVRLAPIGLLWLGFALMLRLLDRFALREDEAVYSYWGLHFWQIDPYFLTVWPDKPPLFLWLLAGALQLWGASQASGRLLNIMVTLLTALVVGATARRLWGQPSGLVATALYLLNPFALSFAPTIYTDPLLVLTGQLALFCAITGRGLGAGLWLAAAIMTKQQGVFYLPLIVLALWLRPGAREKIAWPVTRWGRFLLGMVLVIAPIVYWDSTRWAVAPSPWDLSVRNYGQLELAALEQWLPRTYEWAKLLWYLTASWPVWLLLAGAILVTFQIRRPSGTLAFRRDDYHYFSSKLKFPYGTNAQGALAAPSRAMMCWLVLWSGAFLALHITTTVQIWDRYLLPLAPPLCLLVAWVFDQVIRRWWKVYSSGRIVAELVWLLCLLPPALTAARGGLPIGGDHGAYDGLTTVITRLQQEAPADAILYHQRLGWHYQFYLFDQVTTGVYDLRWYPTATYLAANAAQSPNQPRFLILPDWAPQPDLPLHLATRRLSMKELAHVDGMTLYRIQNQPQTGCVWCRCQGRNPWPIWPGLDQQEESHAQ
jgi:4-amino-4-deoxy-L-arabinose transferase-like glycosyltransferase